MNVRKKCNNFIKSGYIHLHLTTYKQNMSMCGSIMFGMSIWLIKTREVKEMGLKTQRHGQVYCFPFAKYLMCCKQK